jgi:hypothetical protein
MHALVIDVSINDMPAAQSELGQLVPRVSSSPGFVAAYWLALDGAKGTSIAVFDSEANARGMVPPPGRHWLRCGHDRACRARRSDCQRLTG